MFWIVITAGCWADRLVLKIKCTEPDASHRQENDAFNCVVGAHNLPYYKCHFVL